MMAKVLADVPKHGLENVLDAVELALKSGNPNAEHIENVFNRLQATTPPAQVESALTASETSVSDIHRYDRLPEELSHA